MKTLCLVIACVAIAFSTEAQFRVGIKAGLAPTRNMGTSPLIVNRNDHTSDFLFNGNQVEFSPTLGIALRYTKNQFFFEGEAVYYSIRKTYAMQYIGESAGLEARHTMKESCKSVEFPVSAGVILGRFQITSGFSMRNEFGNKSTLTQMQGVDRQLRSTVFGWHGGIGINVGKVSAELKYLQDFSNYGEGIHVNGQELLLRNSPTQLRFQVGLWF